MNIASAHRGAKTPPGPGLFYRSVNRVARLALIIGGWMYVVITCLVCFDIVARRTLGFSTEATTELTGYLMAIGMTFGLAGTLMERGHVRIDVLVQQLPLRLRLWLHGISILALLLSSAFLAWGATTLAIESFEYGAADTSALHLPLALPQSLWATGLVLLVLAVVAVGARALSLALRGDGRAADALMSSRSYMDDAEETLEAVGQHDEAVKLAVSAAARDVGGGHTR